MSLTAGSRLGPYEIVSPLGAGGMGEVYRAHDTKLGRDVAVKILPELFVTDPERVARFEREAQLLAALNHPNIAHVYGLEGRDRLDGQDGSACSFIVMEFVDGESLAETLAQVSTLKSQGSPLPLEEALAIARQIIEALEAAHEKGIIHRDLKPANIMVTADGQVKILDFGLAKHEAGAAGQAGGAGGAGGLTHSPTLTFAGTQAGMILGTAAYMSPEQARGRAADKRADVWAFGCVLFEMLTGKRAFEGEDATDVIAAVVRGEPDWTSLPGEVPAHIRTLLRRCLEKDRKARIGDVAVLRYVMAEGAAGMQGSPGDDGSGLASLAAGARRLQPTALLAGGLAIAAVAVGVTWLATRQRPAPKPLTRFGIVPPANQALGGSPNDRNLAISADGSRVVYVGGSANGSQVIVRALDQLDAVALPGITGARSPFLSPDGRWIGFFTAGELKKVSITGGPPVTLCRVTGTSRGASWGPDDTIVFATNDTGTGLLSVPSGGGEPKVLTKPDAAHGEADHAFPSVLPDGRAVLFTVIPQGPIENAQIALIDLKTNQKKILIRGGSQAEYVESGHLVYGAAGTLRAVRFDLGRLEVAGDPVPVLEHVSMTGSSGNAMYAVSRSGALVYAPGAGQARSIFWVDRQGHEEPIPAPPRAYNSVRISPNGARVAVEIRDQEQDIWIWELARRTLTRLTSDPALDVSPIWTPDGRHIIFASDRTSVLNLFWQSADGTGAAERLTKSPNTQVPSTMTPDGTQMIFREDQPATFNDLQMLTLDQKRETRPLLQAPMRQSSGEISPDGRWLAYQSDESGQNEVYVRPFPDVNGGRWPISISGGTRPAWARNGRELFYLDANNLLTVVPVQTSSTIFGAGNPSKLQSTAPFVGQNYRTYDISPDGKRFLMIRDARDTDPRSTTTAGSMVVVLNWLEELKARVPPK